MRKVIKIKWWLTPKKDTHKYKYLFNNYIYNNAWIETLDINKYRSDYISLINNNTFLIKELTEENYIKLKFISNFLWIEKELAKRTELNKTCRKLNTPRKIKKITNHNEYITTIIDWKKVRQKVRKSPHITYNYNW